MFYAQIVAACAQRDTETRHRRRKILYFQLLIRGTQIALVYAMKKFLGFALLAAGMVYASPQAAAPAQQLFDEGIRQTTDGKLADARVTLRNLVDHYPRDPLALSAKGAIDATLLFEEGHARAKAGKYETARVAFETLMVVYPENPLAARAKSALDTLAEKSKPSRPVLKSVEFRDVEMCRWMKSAPLWTRANCV